MAWPALIRTAQLPLSVAYGEYYSTTCGAADMPPPQLVTHYGVPGWSTTKRRMGLTLFTNTTVWFFCLPLLESKLNGHWHVRRITSFNAASFKAV